MTVCEAGSVTDAALSLKQPKSTVSRHLARLEEELDAALLDRSRKGISLTAEGRRLYEQTRESIRMLEPLGRRRPNATPVGHVRLAAPRYFACGPLSKVIRDFLVECPEVTLECRSDNRLAETHDDDIDVLVSVGPVREVGDEAWPLGSVRARLYGAPLLFGQNGPPTAPAALSSYNLLSHCGTVGVPERLSLTNDQGRSVTIAPTTRLATNELEILIDAARDGLGLVSLPEFVGDQEVALERLVPVLPEYWTDRFMVSIALLSARRNQAARRFVDFAVTQLAKA